MNGLHRDLIKISIVIPIFRGEEELVRLIGRVVPLASELATSSGNRWLVAEIILVHDCGPGRSVLAIEALAAEHSVVRAIWLTKRFGPNAATLSGMAGAVGDWVLTLDEGTSFDANDFGKLMDQAIAEGLPLVYALPLNPPLIGWFRSLVDHTIMGTLKTVFGTNLVIERSPCRLIRGDVARSLAAYCNSGVDIDVALRWIVSRIGVCFVAMVTHTERSMDGLCPTSVLTLDTRLFKRLMWLGIFSVALALLFSIYGLIGICTVAAKLPDVCWAIAAMAFFAGIVLMSLAVIGESLRVTMSTAMGKPPYVVASKPIQCEPKR